MPRIDKAESPGCPPLRAICCDSLGLTKVVDIQAGKRDPQVVARWGEPDLKRGVLSVSLSHDDTPALAIARKNGVVDILKPSTGAIYLEVNVTTALADKPLGELGSRSKDEDVIAGIHLFKANNLRRSLLTCTEGCNATLVNWEDAELSCSQPVSKLSTSNVSSRWKFSNAGSILCLCVDHAEKHVAFGGKGVDANLWDLEKHSKIWEGKTPRRDSLGLISPPFVTASTFLYKSDHRKIVVGTGHHQVRLYDVSAQRRPVLAFDFQESPIKAVEGDSDGYSVLVGNGNGDLASFDMRTGKLIGVFKGKCSGGIRSIARHSELPIIASCGLDRFLRIFDARTRQLLTRVFLKQQLMAVVFDNHGLCSSQTDGAKEDENEDIDRIHLNDSAERLKTRKLKRTQREKKRQKKEEKAGSVTLLFGFRTCSL